MRSISIKAAVAATLLSLTMVGAHAAPQASQLTLVQREALENRGQLDDAANLAAQSTPQRMHVKIVNRTAPDLLQQEALDNHG